jgi:membrane-bound lytic murein transglycosylase D
MTTPRDQNFQLVLPAGTKERFLVAIAAIPQDMRVWWRYHKVAPGETVASIARKYRVAPKAIAQANNLDGEEPSDGSKLIIPAAPGRRAWDSESLAFSKRPTRYKVRKGDTVLSVADDFGVPVERLRKWNRLKGNQLRAGRTLVIYRPLAAPEMAQQTVSKRHSSKNLQASKGKRLLHRVKPGETLYSIASDYNTTVSALRRDNHNLTSNLRAGEVLVIKNGE